MTLFQIYFWVGSVLLAWALARILSGVIQHLATERRVLWAPETILATAFVVGVIAFVWLDLWVTRTIDRSDRLVGALQVVKLFALHFAGAFVMTPLQRGEGPVDTHAYYDRARRLTFIPLIVALLAFWSLRIVVGLPMGPIEWAAAVLLPTTCLALIFVRQRPANVALLAICLVVLSAEAVAYGVRLASPAASASAGPPRSPSG